MKKKRFSSVHLKKILVILLAMETISFSIISVAMYELYSDIVRNVTLMTDSVVEKVKFDLNWINKNLLQTAVSETVWRELDKKDTIEAVSAMTMLKGNYSIIKEQYGNDFNFYVMDTGELLLKELTGVSLNFDSYVKIRSFLKEKALESTHPSGKWRLVSLDGERFVYTYYRNKNRVVGAWIEEKAFLQKLADGEYGEYGQVSLVPAEEFDKTKTTEKLLTRQIVYKPKNKEADFYILVTVSGNLKLVTAVILQYFILFVGICVLAVSAALYFYLRRNVLRPMKQLSERIEADKLSDITKVVEAVEMDDVYTSITNLILQLKGLKIELYEQELEKKQIELNFRRTQIKPHFFINCLSSIYYMAQGGDTEGVKKLSLLVSDYFREVLTDGFEEVSMAQELGHIRNYVAVQSQCNAFTIELSEDIMPEAAEAKLPALIIGTFVENSVRHGKGTGEKLKITVNAAMENRMAYRKSQAMEKEDALSFLHVVISDNAGGFPEKLLSALNNSTAPVTEQQGYHLGINNALTRLSLMYGDNVRTFFTNTASGAKVELWIPQNGRMGARLKENRFQPP